MFDYVANSTRVGTTHFSMGRFRTLGLFSPRTVFCCLLPKLKFGDGSLGVSPVSSGDSFTWAVPLSPTKLLSPFSGTSQEVDHFLEKITAFLATLPQRGYLQLNFHLCQQKVASHSALVRF